MNNVTAYTIKDEFNDWLNDFGPFNTNDALDLYCAVSGAAMSGRYSATREGNKILVRENDDDSPLILDGNQERDQFLSIIDQHAQYPEDNIPCSVLSVYYITEET